MNKSLLATVAIAYSCLANSAYAEKQNENSAKACDAVELSNTEYSQCLDRVKTHIEKELTTWINNQTFILEELAKSTGRRTALSMFQRAQRNFETYRENNCRWQYLALSPGTGAAPAYKKCFILLSRNRITEISQLNK